MVGMTNHMIVAGITCSSHNHTNFDIGDMTAITPWM